MFFENDLEPQGSFLCPKTGGELMNDKAKPKPVPTTTAIVHPPTPPRGKKGSRVTMVLK